VAYPRQHVEAYVDAFDIHKDKLYEEFIPFKDGKVGFSIKRPYPEDIQFRPPRKKDGTPDTLAMIRLLYNPRNLSESELDLTKVPIWIDIGKHSKYQYDHFGFNFEDDNCPTEESLAASQASPHPVALIYTDDFFFDHRAGDFFDKKGKHYSGLQVLQSVFEEHCNTTRESRRRLWRSVARVGFLCESLIAFFEYILRVSFRKRFDRARNPFTPYKKDDVVLLEAESLQIFGYKTTKNVVVTYAALVLAGYTISYWTCLRESTFFISIWKHPFLVFCVTLVTLPLLEYQGPNLIRIAVNGLNSIRFWSIMHSPLYSEEKSKRDKSKKPPNNQQHEDRSLPRGP
jgi:hypothetical protein